MLISGLFKTGGAPFILCERGELVRNANLLGVQFVFPNDFDCKGNEVSKGGRWQHFVVLATFCPVERS